MAREPMSVAGRLHTLEGQVKALREHVGDDGRTCGDVARLVVVIDGTWAAIRSAVLRGWVEDCLLDVEVDDRVQHRLEAIERVAGRGRATSGRA